MIAGEFEMAMAKESEPNAPSSASASMSRKDKRKVAKKEKRKQKRKEAAEMERQEEEARLKDPEEQRRVQLEMERENERLERETREFEERERIFLEALARKKAEEEEEERRRALEEEEKLKEHQAGHNLESNEGDEWEYVDEGPPEIIWQGNEIIVKKNRVKVKKSAHQEIAKENPNRPTSNPLPPQSEAFADYKNASVLSAQQILENVAQQTPNFGTEQDKAHCPFHLKTGACRFGSRCSRVHFYPDKSCTLLMKNMYNGPGLAWEQDEGLEYTDEEVEHSYEEFYEDVHTEFLKFGEIINFKVCRNGSYHLRGNVYVHYKSLDSAVLAHQSINGRYFAGKQVTCEFIGVTRWKVAICGEYMKSRLKTCSRGSACNFIHCFRNPCGDYEWADWDKPPPRSWMEKMAALFGYSSESVYDKKSEEETVGPCRNSQRLGGNRERHHRLRSHSKENDSSKRRPREYYEEDIPPRIKHQRRHISEDQRRTLDLVQKTDEVKAQSRCHADGKKRDYHDEYDSLHIDNVVEENAGSWRKRSRCGHRKRWESDNYQEIGSTASPDIEIGIYSPNWVEERSTHLEVSERSSRKQEASSGSMDNFGPHNRRSVSDGSNRDGRRANGSYSTSDLSDGITEDEHLHQKKSARHLGEVSGSSHNHSDKYPQNGSEHKKSKSKMKTSSGRKKLHWRKASEAECPDEHLKSYNRHEHRKSRLYSERSTSYDSDFSCDSSALEFKILHRESGSHDCRVSVEVIDIMDRWAPDKVDTGNHCKHRKKSYRTDSRRESKELGSHDNSSESSDTCVQESISRGSSKSKEGRSGGSHLSSHKKRRKSSTQSDCERKPKDCGERGRRYKQISDRDDKIQESHELRSCNWSSESSDACYDDSGSGAGSK